MRSILAIALAGLVCLIVAVPAEAKRPALSINDTIVTEPDQGATTTATFTVRLSAKAK
jgi:hypothetical protein